MLISFVKEVYFEIPKNTVMVTKVKKYNGIRINFHSVRYTEEVYFQETLFNKDVN